MEPPTIEPGQVWADNDKRVKGRTLEVLRVEGDYAVLKIKTNDDDTASRIRMGIARQGEDRRGKVVRILRRRMRPTSTGYRLVQDV